MDLSKYNYKQLTDLQAQVEKELDLRREQEKEETVKKIHELAANAGFSVDELLGKKRGRRATTTRVKYRHPEDPTKTWSGRGRRPRWIEDLLSKGRKLEEFEI